MGILIRPVITEKATTDSEDNNRFAFVVDKKANKIEIKNAIEELYGVHIDNIRTMVVPGKRKMRYTKNGVVSGNSGSYKKAIVEVRSGETIDLYSNI
ncbi:MAG TPA: 50S ribosomal protein L23 [Cryomorphaceae bacterium]|nr:50S ribosomal protein L23 [Owenweeksia sp.]HAD97809.1 50S ribosomal protein L23 [Cryomorphaceae bacterium]HBF19350.1 50S ribosomal protein L23 [Cryomorphaceae bacterium]|tara:strand:- start:468 stop:758 length:291 start_codon:yes stop_codon:yes gene_type:complete